MLARSPSMNTKDVQDPVLRRNFELLETYFRSQNQLLDFQFFEQVFTRAETNRRVRHTLGYAPRDVLVSRLTGDGTVRFNLGQFTSSEIFITATGPCKVRFYVGAKDPSENEPDPEDYQEFTATPSGEQGEQGATGPAGAAGATGATGAAGADGDDGEDADPQFTFSLTNNQSSATDITGLSFSPATYQAVAIRVEVRRKTDSEERISVGWIFAYYLASSSTWEIIDELGGNIDDGVTFSMTAGGQIQYATDNMAGTNYSGSVRYSYFTFEGDTSFTIANNQSSAADVTGFLFSSATVKAALVRVELRRKTDSEERVSAGWLSVYYMDGTTTWEILDELSGNIDDGVTFSITSGGQVQYTSDNMSGSNYTATMRFHAIPFTV